MRTFELLKSETLLAGRAFKIRRDYLRTPDGRETSYEIVEHVGSVVMVPVDDNRNVLFVRQYRQAAAISLLELPAGTRDGDEDYQDCAAREMREETGMAAGKLANIGEFYLAPGYSTEYMAVFLASDLVSDPLPSDTDEFLEIERIPIEETLRMAERGQIHDAKSLAALFLARPYLIRYR